MTRQIRFTKMHGAGNDYVVLDGLRETLPADLEAFARRANDRHFGIGADHRHSYNRQEDLMDQFPPKQKAANRAVLTR